MENKILTAALQAFNPLPDKLTLELLDSEWRHYLGVVHGDRSEFSPYQVWFKLSSYGLDFG